MKSMNYYMVKDETTDETKTYEDIFELEEALLDEYSECAEVVAELCRKLRANEYTGDEEAYLALAVTVI